MDCKSFQTRIWEFLDGGLGDEVTGECMSHLEACRQCSAELATSKKLLAEAKSLEKAEAPDFLWQRIEAELDTPRSPFYSIVWDRMVALKSRLADLVTLPTPALKMAGVLAVLAVGVFVGRHFFPSRTAERFVEETKVADARIQLVADRTNDFVEKSKILFLGFVNTDTSDLEQSNFTTEKELAGSLVRQAAVLKDDLAEVRNERLKLLIEELEMILFEISNLEESYDMQNVDLIKSGIDQKGLMLKIHLHDLSENPLDQPKADAKRRPKRGRI